jgi:beta-1,4-mannosyl-glycoprotein beta-1,4-N-acetylglucosaminyltransferase
MIIDAFPYANEELVLTIRLNELAPVVDYFLIVESNRTQTGLPKPYYFEQSQAKFEKFLDKIVYIKLDHSYLNKVEEADWSQEFRVRQAIVSEGLVKINQIKTLSNEDYIIVSDCDEIPRAEVIKELTAKNTEYISINHYFNTYYFNLYSKFRDPWGWYGSVLLKLKYLTQYEVQYIRNIKDKLPHTGNSGEGWHFSNILINGFDSLYSKWINNIEPHDKSCLKDKELLNKQFNKCLYEDNYFFYCDMPNKRDIPLLKLDDNLLPKYIIDNQEIFKNLLC